MGEAYECDRCGVLRDGKAYSELKVNEGRSRQKRGDENDFHVNEGIPITSVDICKACQNDLERWYADAGGDPSDLQHRGVGDSDE